MNRNDALRQSDFYERLSSQGIDLQSLRTIVDAVPSLLCFGASDRSISLVNSIFANYTGVSEKEALSSFLDEYVHPDDLPRLKSWWSTLIEAPKAGETELRLCQHDGNYRWFLFKVAPASSPDGVFSWCGVAVDVESQKRSEQLLQEKVQEYRTITDAVSQYIVVLEPSGEVAYVNRVVNEQTGLLEDDVSERAGGFSRPFHPDDVERVSMDRREGLLRGEPFELEVRVLLKTQQYRWYLMQYNPLKDDEGHVVRWYVTGTDIDTQKRERERLRSENVSLRADLKASLVSGEIIGSSALIADVVRQIGQVAKSDSTVLILGETGTGKELVARALHRLSDRRNKSFIQVNCAAIPQSLISSELFGHEKGAFTGAMQRRQGKFEAADGGTLFLDEVGDLPMETQVVLLRVLQERRFERIGSNIPVEVNIRLVAATHRDLSQAIAEGRFREDLFYRLNVLPITVPPLRRRAEDIPSLVEYFVTKYSQKTGRKIRQVPRQTLEYLQHYSWPGNVRELQNVIERAVILSHSDVLFFDENWLNREAAIRTDSISSQDSQDSLSDLVNREVEIIKSALAETHGRISGPAGAAARLGIPRQTLESKMKKYGIGKFAR